MSAHCSFMTFITICQLVKASVDALDRSRGAAASCQSLISALSNLTDVFSKVKALTETGKVTDLDVLARTFKGCFSCLVSLFFSFLFFLRERLRSLESALEIKIDQRTSSRTRIRPAMKDDIAVFHDNVMMYLAMLQLLLQSSGLYILNDHTLSGLAISNYVT